MELTNQDLINAANQGHLRALTAAAQIAIDEHTREALRRLDPAKADTFKNVCKDEALAAVYAEAFNQTIDAIVGRSNNRPGGLIAYPLKPP